MAVREKHVREKHVREKHVREKANVSGWELIKRCRIEGGETETK